MPDQNLPEINPTALGKAVHAAWRDTMLAQGRTVAPERLVWEHLSADDQLLDIQIGTEVARAARVAEVARHLVMPGQLCRHVKTGGVYRVIARRLSHAYLYVDERVVSEQYEALVTDQIASGEQIVFYVRLGDHACFVRPARLFDQPGRFTCLSESPELLPIGSVAAEVQW
jgi:hypothetical protein